MAWLEVFTVMETAHRSVTLGFHPPITFLHGLVGIGGKVSQEDQPGVLKENAQQRQGPSSVSGAVLCVSSLRRQMSPQTYTKKE